MGVKSHSQVSDRGREGDDLARKRDAGGRGALELMWSANEYALIFVAVKLEKMLWHSSPLSPPGMQRRWGLS